MLPTPKKELIFCNSAISFPCNSIEKEGEIVHPLVVLLLLMVNENVASPSENPVTK